MLSYMAVVRGEIKKTYTSFIIGTGKLGVILRFSMCMKSDGCSQLVQAELWGKGIYVVTTWIGQTLGITTAMMGPKAVHLGKSAIPATLLHAAGVN